MSSSSFLAAMKLAEVTAVLGFTSAILSCQAVTGERTVHPRQVPPGPRVERGILQGALPGSPSRDAEQKEFKNPSAQGSDSMDDFAPDSCRNLDPQSCAVGILVLERLNEERQRLGRGPLNWHPVLAFAAFDWSEEQGKVGFISHDGFPEQRDHRIQEAFGKGAVRVLGENVAYTELPRPGVKSPYELAGVFYKLWKESPSHYANMMAPQFEDVGMGFVLNQDRWYGTQLFSRKL